jgi:hypothetical protein
VGALVERGMLRRMAAAFGRAPVQVLSRMAKVAAVFVVGMLVGRAPSAVRAASSDMQGPKSAIATAAQEVVDSVPVAELVPLIKRTGSQYVAVLAMIPRDTVDSIARLARKVAVETFRDMARQIELKNLFAVPSDSMRAFGMVLAPKR